MARGRQPSLLTATKRELADAGKMGTTLGQQAILIAAKLCDPEVAASAIAHLSKELRTVMEQATSGVVSADDPVDELKGRRDAVKFAARTG